MADSIHRLATLPVELLHCVFRQLDPVALIAASQTCTHFRSIIQPAQKHFAERLLALEIEPEHGGPGLTYFARENRLDPDWNEEIWNDMCWACTHCLRLLPHVAFDNHSILRLKNRKPKPGSPAAKRSSSVTTWEPVERRALSAKEMRRKRAIVAEEREQEKLLRKQYHIATTKTLNEVGLKYTSQTRTQFLRAVELPEALKYSDSQLDNLTEEEEHALLDAAAARLSDLRAGSHRHLRRCNECRFQLGHFKKGAFITRRHQNQDQRHEWAFNNNKGTPDVPILKSRQFKFATPFDRYFPGIEPYMAAERPDFILPFFRIYRKDTTYMLSTLYMARCPLCKTWQELRSFRWGPRGWGYGEFIGVGYWMTEAEVAVHAEEVNRMQCNKCVHNKLGRQACAKRLSSFMREHLMRECRSILGILSGSWRPLSWPQRLPQHEHKSVIKKLLKSLEAAEKKFTKVKLGPGEGWSEIDAEADDVEDNLAMMNRRRLEWLQISVQEQELARHCTENSEWFGIWQDHWDEAIEYWRWAKAWMEEMQKEPEKVVKWALERDAMKLN